MESQEEPSRASEVGWTGKTADRINFVRSIDSSSRGARRNRSCYKGIRNKAKGGEKKN